jgi:hypothetical protein
MFVNIICQLSGEYVIKLQDINVSRSKKKERYVLLLPEPIEFGSSESSDSEEVEELNDLHELSESDGDEVDEENMHSGSDEDE